MVLRVYTGPGAMARLNRRYSKKRRRGVYVKTKTSSQFARAVRSVISPELKFRTLSVPRLAVAFDAPQIIRISSISLGDDQNERTGNWIQPRSIYGSIICEANTTNISLTQEIRVGILRWKEDMHPLAIDVDSLIEDIMQEPESPFGPFRYISTGKFDVLASRAYILSTSAQNSQLQKVFTFKVNLTTGPKITYNQTVGKLNQLYFFATSSNGAASDPPRILFHISMRYNDS